MPKKIDICFDLHVHLQPTSGARPRTRVDEAAIDLIVKIVTYLLQLRAVYIPSIRVKFSAGKRVVIPMDRT